MWYNTYLSIGKPLPNRRNIVLSKTYIDWVEQYQSIDLLMKKLNDEWVVDFFVIWWASIYEQFLDKADILYLTEIKKNYIWDTYFPEFKDKFVEVSREVWEELDFVVYKKK